MTEKPKLKTCKNNPAHVWMADISFCPYCNISPEARVDYQRKENKKWADHRK